MPQNTVDTAKAEKVSRERAWARQQEIAHEPAYFSYLDKLYARHGLIDPRKAVLAELIPLLAASERTKLAELMIAAGYTWRGLTDQEYP